AGGLAANRLRLQLPERCGADYFRDIFSRLLRAGGDIPRSRAAMACTPFAREMASSTRSSAASTKVGSRSKEVNGFWSRCGGMMAVLEEPIAFRKVSMERILSLWRLTAL